MENKQIKIKLYMVIIITIIIIVAVIAMFASTYNKARNQDENEIAQTIQNNNNLQELIVSEQKNTENLHFDYKFLKLENNKKNMIYSPLSIKYALNMLHEGANGNTKIQIENVIGNLSLTKYNNIENVLSLANAVYIRDDYAKYVKEDYKNIVSNKYNSEVKYDAFENANNVNNWISEKTFGIIKNMLKDELVKTPTAKMLLINALAIDMRWKNTFDTSNTFGEEFNLENGTKINATTMHKKTLSDDISYYKDKNITSLTMDLKKYDDIQLEFTAIMPKNSLSDYINEFTTQDIDNIIKKSILASKTKYGINISIPKFSFDYDLKLKDDLKELGINDAFDEALADFTNMTYNPIAFYAGNALHKANIDFTEEGVKAAAVTVIDIKEATMLTVDKKQPEEVKFDKPFIYIIRDKNTGEIWFTGTVYEPNLWENDKADYRI